MVSAVLEDRKPLIRSASMNQRLAQQTRRDPIAQPRNSTIPFHVVTTSPPVGSTPYTFPEIGDSIPKLLLNLGTYSLYPYRRFQAPWSSWVDDRSKVVGCSTGSRS